MLSRSPPASSGVSLTWTFAIDDVGVSRFIVRAPPPWASATDSAFETRYFAPQARNTFVDVPGDDAATYCYGVVALGAAPTVGSDVVMWRTVYGYGTTVSLRRDEGTDDIGVPDYIMQRDHGRLLRREDAGHDQLDRHQRLPRRR